MQAVCKECFDVDILNKIAKIIKERNFSAIRVIKDRNNDIKIEHNENLLLIDNRKQTYSRIIIWR